MIPETLDIALTHALDNLLTASQTTIVAFADDPHVTVIEDYWTGVDPMENQLNQARVEANLARTAAKAERWTGALATSVTMRDGQLVGAEQGEPTFLFCLTFDVTLPTHDVWRVAYQRNEGVPSLGQVMHIDPRAVATLPPDTPGLLLIQELSRLYSTRKDA